MHYFQKVLPLFFLAIITISCSDDDDPAPEVEIQKRIASVDGPLATFNYSYDGEGRLSEILLDWDTEETQIVKFTYDSDDRLVSVTRGELNTTPSNNAVYEYNDNFPTVTSNSTYLDVPYLDIYEYTAGDTRTYDVEHISIDQSMDPQDTIVNNNYEVDEMGRTFNDEIVQTYFYDVDVPNPVKSLNLPVAYDYGFVLYSFSVSSSEIFYESEFWPTRIESKDGTTRTYSYEFDEDGYMTTISLDGRVRTTIQWEEF